MNSLIKFGGYFIGFLISYWLALNLTKAIFNYLYDIQVCQMTFVPNGSSGVPVSNVMHDNCTGYWLVVFFGSVCLGMYLVHRFLKWRKYA